MDLSKIMSVSGKSGLFLSIGQTKNGLIVESLVDKKRFPVYVSDKVSSLADISVFTNDKDIPLKEIFKKISEKENMQTCIDSKSDDKKIKTYFEEILPDYDKERVYVSDMRKMLSWYNLLQSLKMLSFEEEKNEEVKEEK
ncbi:MAG TPA: DUF5606 domain-containing protein [Bacteroidales bacterium]|nr:DUF5606 domain-containing protein [Bacteroidales bacterium]HQI45314.1 DUF5606 domain-containing protein [Bacteroidales bacterium]